MKDVHKKLQELLRDLGNEKGYNSLVENEVNEVIDGYHYRPDVIWEKSKKKIIFEIALTDDPLKMVGEAFLAKRVKGFSKFILIISVFENRKKHPRTRFLKDNIETLMNIMLSKGLPCEPIYFDEDDNSPKNIEKITAHIKNEINRIFHGRSPHKIVKSYS